MANDGIPYLAFLVGVFVALMFVLPSETANDIRIQAVKAGVAVWVAQDDGSTKFEWKTTCP